ncbi:3-deoxy-D-manno-octulosonic acid kinase [Gammaproteobacteria bacterium 2W06]|nr:3-deoxy-D-manno-octulosonic acid kinase [Gammaproteobacteria bacterium 2W06]
MGHISVRQKGDEYFISPDPASPASHSPQLFDVDALRAQGLLDGQATGRAQAYFLRAHGKHLVLRHYRRGGLPRHLSDDRFIWTGLSRSRPWRELAVMARLRALNFFVPVPFLGRVQRQTMTYTADILTERIPGARSMADRVADDASTAIWAKIGRVVRGFHDANAHHPDLNVRNILIDESHEVWLIDWDRGHLRANALLKTRSLARLKRSLDQEPGLTEAFERGWPRLLEAYESGP